MAAVTRLGLGGYPIAAVQSISPPVSTIAGMAWFEPPDQPFYTKPLRDVVAPAFAFPVPPVVTTIAGMAWFEPPDRQPVSAVQPAVAPAFVPPKSVVPGLGWFDQPELPNYAKPSHDTIAPAFISPQGGRGAVGIGWFAPPDDLRKGPSQSFQLSAAPAYPPFKPPNPPIPGTVIRTTRFVNNVQTFINRGGR